jgi:hypothetical protein
MQSRAKIWMTAVGLLCLFSGEALAIVKDDAAVGRLDSASVMRYRGRMRYVLTLDTVDGKVIRVGVQNKDAPNSQDEAYKADPQTELVDQIKAVAPGDIVKLEYTMEEDGTYMMKSIAPYPMEPGMELPNAYLFKEMYDHTEQTATKTLVDLKRFDDVVTFSLPAKKDSSGAMAPDPELVAALGKLKEGQIVLVDATPGSPNRILRSIEPYNTPQTGKITSIKLTEVDGNKTTAAEIDVDGTPVTVVVPGKLDGKRWVVDSKVLSKLRNFRPGANVTFRIITDNGTSYLRDIKAAPKVTAPAKEAAK